MSEWLEELKTKTANCRNEEEVAAELFKYSLLLLKAAEENEELKKNQDVHRSHIRAAEQVIETRDAKIKELQELLNGYCLEWTPNAADWASEYQQGHWYCKSCYARGPTMMRLAKGKGEVNHCPGCRVAELLNLTITEEEDEDE
jgi:hypothetical protein